LNDCVGIRNELSAYIDGELTPDEAERVRSHLAQCPACREEEEALRRVAAAVGELPSLAAPPGLRQATLERVRAERPRRTARRLRLLWPAAAAILIALALTMYSSLGRRSRSESARYLEKAAPRQTIREAPVAGPATPTPGEALRRRATALPAGGEAAELRGDRAVALEEGPGPELQAFAQALVDRRTVLPVELFIPSPDPEQARQEVQSLLVTNRIATVSEAEGVPESKAADALAASQSARQMVLRLTPAERAQLVQLLFDAKLKPAVTTAQAAVLNRRREALLRAAPPEVLERPPMRAGGRHVRDKEKKTPRVPVTLNFIAPPLPRHLLELPPPAPPESAGAR